MASITASPPFLALDEDEVPERRIPMTYDEYWAWGQQEGHHGEWVDGEVIVFMTTSDRHQRILSHLMLVLGNYLSRRRLGRIYSQTFEMRSRDGAAREPDIVVLLNEHLARLESVRVRGAADLAVEIISPDSVTRDRKVKLAEYAAAGLPEYWVVDPRERHESIQILALGEEGEYVAVQPGPDGRLWSTVLSGVWADPAWLAYDDELPDSVTLSLAMVAAAESGGSTPPTDC